MKKMNNPQRNGFFLLIILMLSLPFSCYKAVKPEPTPEPTPTPPNDYLPSIRVEQKGECDLGDRTLFVVNPDGTFTYINNVYVSKGRTIEAPISTKLSANEVAGLKNMLNQADIYELARQDYQLPATALQSKECRAVDYFYLNVNNQPKVFDRNARLVAHSQEYTAFLDKLKSTLEGFKKPQQVQIFPYDFPLIVTANDECNPGTPGKTLYNVADNGDFTYLATDKNERVVRKKITQDQLGSLRNLLDQLNLSYLSENETTPYEETPENQACRVIESYMVMHNSREEFFDRNGRKYQHSTEYLAALDKLRAKLEEIKNSK
jgi:hypothetical protein